MWRSEFDLLVMAKEHNQDLIQEAARERLLMKLQGRLIDRIKTWLASKAPVDNPDSVKSGCSKDWQPKSTRVYTVLHTKGIRQHAADRTIHPVKNR